MSRSPLGADGEADGHWFDRHSAGDEQPVDEGRKHLPLRGDQPLCAKAVGVVGNVERARHHNRPCQPADELRDRLEQTRLAVARRPGK